jgi:hypothetical protein
VAVCLQVRNIGPNSILLLPDTRSERSVNQVLPPLAWDVLLREVERRLAARPGAVQHLIVLLPVPIVYPKIPVTETMLGAISSTLPSLPVCSLVESCLLKLLL